MNVYAPASGCCRARLSSTAGMEDSIDDIGFTVAECKAVWTPLFRLLGISAEKPHAVESKRLNSSCWYTSRHEDRRILPLVVIGMEPGGTSTRSATRRPCDF